MSKRFSEKEVAALLKKGESDAALIESLNRYIEALESRAAMQAELIRELKEKLGALLAMPDGRKKAPN